MISRIIIGLMVIFLGFFMAWKTDWFYDIVGPIDFAEKFFSRGTHTFLKLLGILIIFIGAVIFANLDDLLIEGTIGRLFYGEDAGL